MDRKDKFPWTLLPWAVVVLSVINMWRMILMSMMDISVTTVDAVIGAAGAIVAALIAGIITLIVQNRQLKIDSGILAEIRKNTVEDIKPSAAAAQNSTSRTEPLVTEIDTLQNRQMEILAALSSDLDHRKRMEASAGSRAVSDRDLICATVTDLFSRYAKAERQIETLSQENAQLKEQLWQAEQELTEYRFLNLQDGPTLNL